MMKLMLSLHLETDKVGNFPETILLKGTSRSRETKLLLLAVIGICVPSNEVVAWNYNEHQLLPGR